MAQEVIIKDTHRGLFYQDGVMLRVLEAGRYEIPRSWRFVERFMRRPKVEIRLVDVRERDLTIKGQEILTADKVALRVSIVVRFRVIDALASIHAVENYEDRLYTDVQLAARRSLASMVLEDILTNRNRLSEDILADVTEAAATYGVAIGRADVKDLIFPGNLQQIMNRVLEAERMSEARLVDARTNAEVERLSVETRTANQRMESEAETERKRRSAQSEAEALRIKTQADVESLRAREQAASAYREHPALLRMLELDALRDLSRMANARIYIDFDSGQGKSRSNGVDE